MPQIVQMQLTQISITGLWLLLAAVGGACSRTCEKSTVVSNGLRLKKISAAIELHLADQGRLPETIFALPGYDDQAKYIDSDCKRVYDWLYFPSGLRDENGKVFFVMSPTEVLRDGKTCRIILFEDGVVDILPVNAARLAEHAASEREAQGRRRAQKKSR